jgi:hypothetical protein
VPQRGAKCPFGWRVETTSEWESLTAVEKASRAAAAAADGVDTVVDVGTCDGGGYAYVPRNALSQTLSSARPCAILALRATVHGVEASRSLSSVSRSSGRRCAWSR